MGKAVGSATVWEVMQATSSHDSPSEAHDDSEPGEALPVGGQERIAQFENVSLESDLHGRVTFGKLGLGVRVAPSSGRCRLSFGKFRLFENQDILRIWTF